jgi:eukaryotic-like serine/threonine-protein kinase
LADSFPIPFGRYTLVERLAVGGMAELFLATMPGEHGFAKQIVIKKLLPHLAHEPGYTAMFIDEAKLTARLIHPKIAQTYELGKVDDSLFIAMEYIEGVDVLAMLRECAHRRERVDPTIAAWVAHEVLDALDYAHSLAGDDGKSLGVVHRDISPSNVLLSVRGNIKLVDFGIAHARSPGRAHKTKSGTLKGKYGYMSPEQVLEQPVDHRSDLFSVGIVLAEMLTGRRLFAAANELDVLLMVRDARLQRLDKYGSEIDAGLDKIVRKALKKPLDERWPTAMAFREAISEWLFEQRRRVTTKELAEMVTTLRTSMIERAASAAQHDAVSTAILDNELGRGTSQSESALTNPGDGIPGAILDVSDSMPLISLEYDEQQPSDEILAPRTATGSSPPLDQPRRGGRSSVPPPSGQRAPTGQPIKARVPTPSASSIGPAAAAAAQQQTGPIAGVGTKPSAAGLAFSAAEAAAAIDAAIPSGHLDIGPELSARFPSIEAAIESLMPMDPDPAARDFDDSAVDSDAERSASIQLPQASELVRRKPPTPPTIADIADEPDDAGEFGETAPLRVLFRLMTAKSTGLLVVAVGGIKKEIYVRDGQPEFVTSNVASELFGNYLITKGVLSDGELAMALAMMPHYGGKLGDTLVGLGLLKPLEVFRHLTRQVRTKLIDVCSWTKGSFAWYSGRENPREAFPLDLNTYEVLGAGAMGLAAETIEIWLEEHRTRKLKPNRGRRVGPERFELKGLAEVAERIDGKTSVGQLIELGVDKAERLKIARMLYLLESCDLAK